MLIRQFPDKTRFDELAEHYNVIPVCAEILLDTETPVSLLGKLYRQQGPIFLLESVEGGERWGRYSFLGLSANCEIRVFPETVDIQQNGLTQRVPHHGDPLQVLKELIRPFRPADLSGMPRFWSGLVGYLTYEMVSFFEAIPNRLPPEKPLAHFVIPNEVLIFDNIRHTLLIVAPAFLDGDSIPGNAYDQALAQVERIRETMTTQPAGKPDRNANAALDLTSPVDPDDFRERVRGVKQLIHDGEIIQAVIAQPFHCDTPPDPWQFYRAQRYINPSPYLYFLHLGQTVLVGSSPETMVRLENGTATLRPIAGTRPRGKSEQEDRALADDLLSDEKERAEHLMLVDLGRNDLGRVAETGTVQVTDLMIVERYSHVMHLVSNIQCDLKPECDAWELLRATFPAGTLSGAPKVRAMEIIDEVEQEARGPYGGAVGYIAFNGNMDLAITIRTACIEDGRLTVRAGAGIVADSDPESERLETVNKAKALQKALKLLK